MDWGPGICIFKDTSWFWATMFENCQVQRPWDSDSSYRKRNSQVITWKSSHVCWACSQGARSLKGYRCHKFKEINILEGNFLFGSHPGFLWRNGYKCTLSLSRSHSSVSALHLTVAPWLWDGKPQVPIWSLCYPSSQGSDWENLLKPFMSFSSLSFDILSSVSLFDFHKIGLIQFHD